MNESLKLIASSHLINVFKSTFPPAIFVIELVKWNKQKKWPQIVPIQSDYVSHDKVTGMIPSK
jgi:hypothetical protein